MAQRPDRMKILRSVPTEMEAAILVAHLDGAGIEAWSEGGLAGDILDGVERILGNSFSGAAPFTVLAEIGIAKQADGTLALDATTLQNAFNADADGATALINQAATALDDFTETFTRFGGTIANAAQRLQQKLNFLGTRTSGADFALSVLQQQAARQYAAVLTLGDYF